MDRDVQTGAREETGLLRVVEPDVIRVRRPVERHVDMVA